MSPMPAPATAPCTPATTGTEQFSINRTTSCQAWASCPTKVRGSAASAKECTFPPTQKRDPLPSSRTALVRGGRSANAAARASASAGSTALPVSGRLSVIRQTSRTTSVSTGGRSCASLMGVLPSTAGPDHRMAQDQPSRDALAPGGGRSGAGGFRPPLTTAQLRLQLAVDRRTRAAELVRDLPRDVVQLAVLGERVAVLGEAGVGRGEHPVPC